MSFYCSADASRHNIVELHVQCAVLCFRLPEIHFTMHDAGRKADDRNEVAFLRLIFRLQRLL